MEDVPVLTRRVRLPLNIAVAPYLRDHRIEGRTVFPAVETLRVLASSLRSWRPEIPVHRMVQASFPRFLPVGAEESRIEAFHEAEVRQDGEVLSTLLTKGLSRSGGIGRMRAHASVRFGGEAPPVAVPPFRQATRLEGRAFVVPADRLYRELVPFGPAWRNVMGDGLALTEAGALAHLSAGDAGGEGGALGSPFPMDAGLHCACVWGQRFAGVVAFPVGFEERRIFRPIPAGEICVGRVVPVRTSAPTLVFDLWIYGLDGDPREAVLGVAMRDVTAGRMKPPDWVRA